MRMFSWKARRAGGRITITGKDSGGETAKIVGVDRIEPINGRIMATDKLGDQHELVL
jgi:hypothetical protein